MNWMGLKKESGRRRWKNERAVGLTQKIGRRQGWEKHIDREVEGTEIGEYLFETQYERERKIMKDGEQNDKRLQFYMATSERERFASLSLVAFPPTELTHIHS